MAVKRDRLARAPLHAAMIEQLVERSGGKILTCDGASEGDTSEAEMLRGMMDLFAQYERMVLRARTKTALAQKKARGERTGGVPYGMQLSADGLHIEPNAQEQAVIARARTLHQQGLSSRKIAAKLAEQGMVSRMGTVFTPSAILNMVHT